MNAFSIFTRAGGSKEEKEERGKKEGRGGKRGGAQLRASEYLLLHLNR